jgi:ABC-type glycerol-3-phosphate transport system permease component
MKGRLERLLIHAILLVLVVAFLGPLGWLVSTSLKEDQAMFKIPPQILPRPITLLHYKQAIIEFPALQYMKNTLLIVLLTTVGNLLSCSMAAYAFSRLQWPDRKLVFGLLLATLMIPGQVTMIPVYILFTRLHWIDTFLPLIVPAFFGNAFFIFLLRQFFMTIPEDLLEAARMDGAGEMRVFGQILLPLTKPGLLTVALFTILGAWNDFTGPLIYLSSDSKRTLALGLAHLNGVEGTEWGLLMAASMLMVLPALLLFFICQRFFIEGIALTGTKA